MMADEFAIEARGLSKHFGDLAAVSELNLDVPRAQIYGFLGPNGSGKSTTIRMLCGLLTPTKGSANVLGTEIPGDSRALKPKIGYMTQKFSLYDDLTIQETKDIFVSGIKFRLMCADLMGHWNHLPCCRHRTRTGNRRHNLFAKIA